MTVGVEVHWESPRSDDVATYLCHETASPWPEQGSQWQPLLHGERRAGV